MMHNPSHPGEIIREEVIKPMKLSVTDAAKALGVTRQTLSNLLNYSADLSPEMAVRIEKVFGPKADHLLRIQSNYDLAQARRKMEEIDLTRFEPVGA